MSETPEPDLTCRAVFPFWTQEKIRFGDVDRQNHVNNLVICQYVECSRVELRERCFPHFAKDQAIAWLIVHFEATFKATQCCVSVPNRTCWAMRYFSARHVWQRQRPQPFSQIARAG